MHVYSIQLMFIFEHVICEPRIGFICHTFFHAFLTVKSAENKVRKCKSTLLQGAGLYIAKKQKPVLINKYGKINKAVNPN